MEITNSRQNKIFTVLLSLYAATVFMFNGQDANLKFIYASYAVLVLFLAWQVLESHILKFNQELVFLFAYLIFGLLSFFWAEDKSITLSRFKAIFLMVVLCLLIYNWNEEHRSQKGILVAMIAGGAAETAYCFYVYGYQGLVDIFTSGVRLNDLEINNVNALANTLAIAFVGTVALALFEKKRFLFLLLIPEILLLAVFQSRTATIAAVAGVLIAWVLKMRDKKSNFFAKVFFSFLMLLLILLAIQRIDETFGIFRRFSGMFSFFNGGQEGLRSNSLNNRLEYIQYGFQEFIDSPIVGTGLGNAGNIIRTMIGKNTYLHNNYIEILASGGLIGFGLYYGFYLSVFIKHIRLLKANRSGVAAASFCILCAELIEHIGIVNYYSKVSYLAFALWLAVIDMPTEADGEEN